MARQIRIDFPGALHHVTSRGNERRDIVVDDVDREQFVDLLGRAVVRFGWSVTAWVLMTNHFHLVVHTPEPNLSRGMHWLNTAYCSWFNRRHERCGHLFQGRFKSIFVQEERYFRELLRYVVLNPVRARMVPRPEDDRWSSYRATAGLDPAPGWLDTDAVLGLFDTDKDAARPRYRQFVEKSGDSDCIWDHLVHGVYLGDEAWAVRFRTLVESEPRSADYPRTQRGVGRPRMRAILKAVSEAAGVNVLAIRQARGGPLRALSAWIGWHEGWLPLRTIAAALLLRSEGHVSDMVRRCEREFAENPNLVRQLDQVLARLRE